MGEGYIPHPIQKWLDIFRENVDELWVQGDKKNKELHVETTVLVILLTLQKKISIYSVYSLLLQISKNNHNSIHMYIVY